MHKRLKGFIKFASFPLGLFLLLYFGGSIWHAFGLPSVGEVVGYARAMYEVHGYWLVFVAALMEGCPVLNWYLPGSVVVLTGTVFAIDGGQSVAITIALVIIAFFIMAIVNYLLGKYGWYKLFLKFGLKAEIRKVQERLKKYGFMVMLISYVHPHTGALVSTAAGILQMDFKTFLKYTAFSYFAWATFWTLIAYTVGPQFLSVLDFKALLIVVAFWIFIMAFQYMWHIWKNRRLVYVEIINHRSRIFKL